MSIGFIDNVNFGEDNFTQLDSFEEILREILGLSKLLGDEHNGLILFRGQGTPHFPMPGIARGSQFKIRECERDAIEELKLRGSYFPEAIGRVSSEIELLIAAQHYGMKTRLLDWTSCLPVALWFAMQSTRKNAEDKFRYLYAFVGAARHPSLNITLDELDSSNSYFSFQPADTGGRVSAQHSWFTIHPFSEGRYGWGANFKPASIFTYKIPTKSRREIINSLSLIGFNERTIMPDFSGLCLYLNRKYLTDIHEQILDEFSCVL